MKKLHIAIATALGTAVLFLLVPPDTKSSIGESWLRLTGDPGQACFDYERKSLNDPITAKLQQHVVISKSSGEVVVTYSAKNSFGAYLPAEGSCIVKSGKVDVAATKGLRAGHRLKQMQESALQDLAATSACLQDKIAKLKAGQIVSPLPCPGQ